MKIVFFLSLICLVSCVEIEDNQERYESDAVKNSVLLDNIMSYIAATHEPATRGGDSYYNIYPYLYEGDTVLYVANYDDGWQIFSNSEIAPMVLASSETGHLDLEDETFQDSPMYAYIEGIAEDVRYSQSLSSQRDNPIIIDSVLWANTRIVRIDTVNVRVYDHLLETKWGNKWPWNEKCRIIDGQHVQVGCGAVAIGQYLYYQHMKNGIPVSTMSHATLNSTTGIYSYSNPSSTIWDKMALTRNDANTDSTAVFLGFVSESIPQSHYGVSETATNPNQLINYLNNLGFSFEIIDIDYADIINQIQSGEPVIITVNKLDNKGHALIVDGIKKESIVVYYFENGTPNIKLKRCVNTYIKMNWGWDGVSDEVWFLASDANDWHVTYSNVDGNFVNHFIIPGSKSYRKMFSMNR